MKKVTTNDTAILIFAKSAKVESKRLASNYVGNCNLISVLNRKVENTAKESGFPHIVIDENQQIGNSFGERLSNAFEHMYSLGFKNVIAVGNDCPSLTVDDLKKAYHALEEKKTVIGPDTRGGVYLLGISQINFKTSLIQNSNWQDESTFSQLLEIFNSTYILRAKRDLNDKKDFQSFLRNCCDYELIKAFHSALSSKKQSSPFELVQKPNLTVSNQIVLRGPPAFLY